jgi:hypothetical protein
MLEALAGSNSKNKINYWAAMVNEIMIGYYMLGAPGIGSWSGYVNPDFSRSKLTEIKKKIPATEYKIREDRAKAQAGEIRKWISSAPHNVTYGGGVKQVLWTIDQGQAPGILARATGKPTSKGNPADLLLGFGNGAFLGISAKSGTEKHEKQITLNSPGLKTVDKELGTTIEQTVNDMEHKAIKDYNLPEKKTEMKPYLRQEENIFLQQATIDEGKQIIRYARDKVLEVMSKMDQDTVKKLITRLWLKMGDFIVIHPYYIKVTAIGESSNIKVNITDPVKNSKLYELYNGQVTFQSGGDSSITVLVNNKPYFNIFSKYRSEKIATTLQYQVKGF